MTVFNDTWRFLVQRKLWPVAILLVAAAAAVPFLLGKEPAAPAGPAAAVGGEVRRDSTLATEPIVAPAGDARPRRSPPRARLAEEPVQAQRHPDAGADGDPRASGGGTAATAAAPATRVSAAGAPTAPSATAVAPGGTTRRARRPASRAR